MVGQSTSLGKAFPRNQWDTKLEFSTKYSTCAAQHFHYDQPLYVIYNRISSKTACILSKVCINIEKRVNVIRLYQLVDNPEFIANYVWISTEAGGTCNTLVQKS